MQHTYKIILFILLPFVMFGQDELPGGEVEVIKNFEANLIDVEKVNVKGELPPIDTKRTPQDYSVPEKSVSVDYEPPQIKPIGMKTKRPGKGYKGYLKAGYGYPSSPLLNANYTYSKRKKYAWNIDLNHFAANNSKNIENQRFSNSGGKLSGTVYRKNGVAISGHFGVTADRYYLYGYDHEDTTFTEEAAKQKFNIIEGGLSIHNAQKTTKDIDYHAKFDTYRLTDNFLGSEAGFDINLGATKWFNDKNPLTLNISSIFTSFNDTSRVNSNVFLLSPSYTHHMDGLSVKVGMNLAYFEDDNFAFLPDLLVNLKVGDTGLDAFAGWEGSVDKNSYRRFTNYNPYTNKRRLTIKDSQYSRIFAGVKGAAGKLKYKAIASYNNIQNMPLYLTDSLDTRLFKVLYDTAKVTKLQVYLDYTIQDLKIALNVSQKIFSLENQEKAWGLPAFESNLSLDYSLLKTKKLHVGADIYVANGIPFKNEEGQADNLNALLDVSVGADYYFTKKIGMFIDLNNIASNKRVRWNNYPTFGINVIGGIKVRF